MFYVHEIKYYRAKVNATVSQVIRHYMFSFSSLLYSCSHSNLSIMIIVTAQLFLRVIVPMLT